MSGDDVARRVAALYPRGFFRSYVRWKVRLDPAYDVAFQSLRGSTRPLADLGCGVGVLAAYLRECGF